MKLVPDATLFSDNYERTIEDEEHVGIRVKARDRPLSTKDFKTKVVMRV
jgi:hypothetical protein